MIVNFETGVRYTMVAANGFDMIMDMLDRLNKLLGTDVNAMIKDMGNTFVLVHKGIRYGCKNF